MKYKHEEIESTPESRLYYAEKTLYDLERWIEMSLEIARSFGFYSEKLRENLLIAVKERAMEDEYCDSLDVVEEVSGWSARQDWEKRFAYDRKPLESVNAIHNMLKTWSGK